MTPYLIPLVKHSKHPDVPEGESWKSPKYQLTIEQAQNRLNQDMNVGVVATGQDIVIFDLDNPSKYEFRKETLTVKTRSGKLHKYYLNGGDVKNADGKGQYAECGEVRASWKYVVAPGSYVPCDKSVSDGVYRVIVEKQPSTLHGNELPKEFLPTVTEENLISPLIMDGSFRNCHGWSIEDIRRRDEKIDELLKNNNSNYPSASEADMAALAKLLFWEYSENEAITILRHFRDREKLLRDDYLKATIAKINRKDTISKYVNVKYWTPKEGANRKPSSNETTEKMEDMLSSLNQQFTFKTPTDIEEIYYYKEGVYDPAEQKIKGLIESWLNAEATTHFVEEVLNHIRRSSYVERSEFNKTGSIIPVQNGLLNLATLQLEPFDKDKIFTYKLNVEYDPTKQCPKFQKFLTEILEPEDIPTLQEYLGYCLIPAMPFHKMIWFYGLGRNGKGRIIATLQAILGAQNCANLNLEEFYGDRRFSVAHLYGKMINVSSEPSTTRALQTPLVKKITGEDYIDAEVKNKQHPVKFINFAKLFILGNRFPRVNDNTIAFWDRVLLIRFPYSFIGKDQIVDIEKTWINNSDERSGILNWMVEGLARLLSNNEFTVSKTTKESTLEFKRVSDTTLAFLDEQCEYDKTSFYIRADLYDLYKEYCDIHCLFVDDEKVFTSKLKQNPKIKSQKRRIEGKACRIWVGLKVNPIRFEEDNEVQGEAREAREAPILSFFSELKERDSVIEKECKIPASAASAASAQSITDRFCGQCEFWHKGNCSFPGDPSCVVPTNPHATFCREFMSRLEVDKT